MKILLYGDVAAPGSGAWCYADAFVKAGHEVVAFSDDELLGQSRLSRKILWRAIHAAWEPDRRRHVESLSTAVRRAHANMVLIFKGLHLGPQDVRRLRQSSWVALLNHDDYFSANRANWSPLQRRALREYDRVYVTRDVNLAEVRPYSDHVELLRFAFHPQLHRPLAATEAFPRFSNTDVLFVGTWESQRAEMLEALVQRVPANYAIWGNQWDRVSRASPLRRYIQGRALEGDAYAAAVHAARISLGFLRKANRDEYTQRTFEIPACKGVLLAERSDAHATLFREGVEAEFFSANDPDELVEKVRQLLADDERRSALREAGFAAVWRGQHTYDARISQIIAAMPSSARGGHPT